MKSDKQKFIDWFKAGEPWIWLNATAVSLSIIAVLGLLGVIAVNGFAHFWPSDIVEVDYQLPNDQTKITIIGQITKTEEVPVSQVIASGIDPLTLSPNKQDSYQRLLIRTGNRDVTGQDFNWYWFDAMHNKKHPDDLMLLERLEWGNFYGRLISISENGKTLTIAEDKLWHEFSQRLARVADYRKKIKRIEKNEIGSINHKMERLRLKERGYELKELSDDVLQQLKQDILLEKQILDQEYEVLQKELAALYGAIARDSILAMVMSGQQVAIKMSEIVRAEQPNRYGLIGKFSSYFEKMAEFLTEDPREANTEGGIFPAIFGTVMMVLLMTVLVTPFGVIAAVYLREYASQGFITRTIRIAVNNLAGVPSIVYGVFGLGFFVYFVGGGIDELFFKEALPAPTFGTPGLLWASLTLSILTVPVVIVATEEGLTRIPRSVREGSLALGATKFETLTKVVLPMSSPAMMTGLILAVARAAGEVAPLMLVGVVKLAPSLPVDGNFPYFHLDQQFMHLGFHIYDVGFQSPNVEAARPLVYATALLLVIVIALLNFSAVMIRNRLREKYKALEN